MKKSLKIPKCVIRCHESKKNGQYNGQSKKRQTMIYTIVHRKINVEQHEP